MTRLAYILENILAEVSVDTDRLQAKSIDPSLAFGEQVPPRVTHLTENHLRPPQGPLKRTYAMLGMSTIPPSRLL